MYGIVFAFATAILYGVGPLLIKTSMKRVDADAGAFISTSMMLPLYLGLSAANGEVFLLPDAGLYVLGLFILVGVMHYVVGRTFHWHSVKYIGASRASQMTKADQIFTVLLASILLAEPLTLPIALGATAIFTGAFLITRSRSRGSGGIPTGFRRGIVYGLLAGGAWGTSPLLIRAGLQTFSAPIAGALMGAISGIAGFTILFLMKGRLGRLAGLSRSSIVFVMMVGIVYAVAVLCRFLALVELPATVFAPIQGTTPLFSLLFSYLFMRESEAINLRVGVGAAFTAAGTYVIVFA